MKILGIETSCDETAAAIVTDKRAILSNHVLSQLKDHRAFGGVVPEIAARVHMDHLDTLIRAALDDAQLTFTDLDGVAATSGPGLIGGVMVGMMAGKAIAAAHDLPFIGVNHMEAHALTPRLMEEIAFPYLLLLVSGGHTQILLAKDVNSYELWGTTIDDALGECFDKSAKLMGLGYPGGPNLEKAALECQNHESALARFPLPRPLKGRKNCDFSFSGLKTAIRTHVDAMASDQHTLVRDDVNDLSYAFEIAICDTVSDRLKRAIVYFKRRFPELDAPSLVVSGGVAANLRLRNALKDLTGRYDLALITPPVSLCGDNAAMVAWAGIERLQRGLIDSLDCAARPRWPLDPDGDKHRRAIEQRVNNEGK